MTITVSSSTPDPEQDTHTTQLQLRTKRTHGREESREVYPDGVNPVMETSKWAVAVSLLGDARQQRPS